MAKNRKPETAALRVGVVVKALLLCVFVGGAGVGYVWNKNQIHQLGREIKARELQLAELQRRNKMRTDQLAALVSPPALEARVRRLNLGLAQPPLSQVVVLAEPPVVAPGAGRVDARLGQFAALE